MQKVEIAIDGSITLADLRTMARTIGATVRSVADGRLLITKQPPFGLDGIKVTPIRARLPRNVVQLRGDQ